MSKVQNFPTRKPIKLSIEVQTTDYSGKKPKPIKVVANCEIESIREMMALHASESILPDPEKGFKQDTFRSALAVFRLTAKSIEHPGFEAKDDWMEEYLDDPAREWVAVSVGHMIYQQFGADRARVMA